MTESIDIQLIMKQTLHFKRNILTFFKKVAVFLADQNDPYKHPFVNIHVVVGSLWQKHKSLFL